MRVARPAPKPVVARRLNFSNPTPRISEIGSQGRKKGVSMMLGIGLGYGTFAVLVILIVCLWAVPF